MHNNFTKYYQRLLVVTLLLGLIVILWGLGSMSLMSLNEGRRALAIKEMFYSGDWLVPRLNGELYLTKPPFLYWISASISSIFGSVTEWTLRLPSALAGLALLGMTYQYTNKYFGKWAALFAVQLLIANAGFAMLARRAEIEMLLTALCVGAILSAVHYIKQEEKRYWIYLSYFLLGLAVLTKGPVAMLFVTLPFIIAAFWTKDVKIKQLLTNKAGWLIFLVVSLSWYVIVSTKLGPDIWATIIKRDMLGKMQGDNNVKPLLSYIGWVAVDFLLLVGLLFVKPKALFKQYQHQISFIIPILAIMVPLIVFSVFSNKHAKYLLPIYPFIAIVLGVQLARIFETGNQYIKMVILAIGILLPLIFAGFYTFAEARIFDYRVSVFPKFRVWSATVNQSQLYTYGDIDSRLIYYSSKPVQSLDKASVNTMRQNHESMILLIETDHLDEILPDADCKLEEFQPYLKKNKKLEALGFGAACNFDDGN